MARVTTASSSANPYTWEEDVWYPVSLTGWEINPAGREITIPGKPVQTAKSAQLAVTWALLEDPETWIRDWINLTLRPKNDGTHAKVKLLICALAGKNPRDEATPWIDDETLEYGFDADAKVAAGKIASGIEMRVKGVVKTRDDGDYLSVTRYALPDPSAKIATPSTAEGTLSPDGRWRLVGNQWVPATPAVPVVPATPTQEELL
jgi:hypothetical protein